MNIRDILVISVVLPILIWLAIYAADKLDNIARKESA